MAGQPMADGECINEATNGRHGEGMEGMGAHQSVYIQQRGRRCAGGGGRGEVVRREAEDLGRVAPCGGRRRSWRRWRRLLIAAEEIGEGGEGGQSVDVEEFGWWGAGGGRRCKIVGREAENLWCVGGSCGGGGGTTNGGATTDGGTDGGVATVASSLGLAQCGQLHFELGKLLRLLGWWVAEGGGWRRCWWR